MKKVLSVLVVSVLMSGMASADVVVINSMGEEALPVWLVGLTATVNSTDSAGQESDSCIQLDITASWFEVFNDHYVADGGTPYDVSTANGYVNFYVKVVNGTLDGSNEVYGSNDAWTNGFGLGDPFVWPAAGDGWVYVSLEVATLNDVWGTMDWSAMDTIGLASDGTSGDIILIDHWTMTTTSVEGMLTPAAAPATVSSFDRDTAIDEPFTGGTAAWTITFSEGVDGIAAGQFTVTGTGVTFTGPTITSGVDGEAVFGVAVTGVSAGPGSLAISFNPLLAGGVTTTAGGDPVVDTANSSYSNVPVAPTATSWVLVFLGLVLALATAITLRKKAISN